MFGVTSNKNYGIIFRNISYDFVDFSHKRARSVNVRNSVFFKVAVNLFRYAVCSDNYICIRRNFCVVFFYHNTLFTELIVDCIVMNNLSKRIYICQMIINTFKNCFNSSVNTETESGAFGKNYIRSMSHNSPIFSIISFVADLSSFDFVSPSVNPRSS